MYCKYSDGSLVTLTKARYTRTDPQDLTAYHIPLTDINGAIPLGLNWQTWTINGVIADPLSVRWRDIVSLSLDNVSWRTCRYQTVGFPSNMYQQSLYELTMLVSPLLEGAIVRYPSSGYLWGNQGIAGLSQAGNVNAFPTIHYLAPLFYAPLNNTLIDFAGQAVTFTRTAAKYHGGVLYPINTPIFDNGLYFGSDVATDRVFRTFPVSTVRTVAMQLKSRLVNLMANGTFESGYGGWVGNGATVSLETGVPLVGTGSLKIVTTTGGTNCGWAMLNGLTVGHQYLIRCQAKSTAAAGRLMHIFVDTGGSASASFNASTLVTATLVVTATDTTFYPAFGLVSGSTGEILYIDSVVCFDLTAANVATVSSVLTIWGFYYNSLIIDIDKNLIKWTDDTTTVSLALPAAYLSGTVMDVVVIDDISHAVTIAVHPTGGSWTSASGTLAALSWGVTWLGGNPFLPLEGSIANLVQYPYVLTSAEYQALSFSSLSLLYNSLYIGNRYAGEIVKGSDKRLLNASGSDISALLGGVDIPIGSAAVTIAQSQGQSARWYVELKRTDV